MDTAAQRSLQALKDRSGNQCDLKVIGAGASDHSESRDEFRFTKSVSFKRKTEFPGGPLIATIKKPITPIVKESEPRVIVRDNTATDVALVIGYITGLVALFCRSM